MEYEDKTDLDCCGTCKFYFAAVHVTSSTTSGWCSKRPRLYQKHDDRTHRTNWCQYYEANMEARDKLDAMMQEIEQQVNDPNKEAVSMNGKETPPHSSKTTGEFELKSQLNELRNLQKQARESLVSTAELGSEIALAEMRGVVKTLNMILVAIESRLQQLSATE